MVACFQVRRAAFDPAVIDREVRAALSAFADAQRRRDPDAVLAFLAHDFGMMQDGARVDGATTRQQIRGSLANLRAVEPSFSDVVVLPIAEDAALTSMAFRDTVTAADGSVLRARGPTTLLWCKRFGEWRIVFADADHYAVED
jgi:ketosteroid isomerase-like protein